VLAGPEHGRTIPLADIGDQLAMTKLGIGVGILATVFCLSAGAQTINVMVLNQAGAQTVVQAAERHSSLPISWRCAAAFRYA
jgi:hypothetical protein